MKAEELSGNEQINIILEILRAREKKGRAEERERIIKKLENDWDIKLPCCCSEWCDCWDRFKEELRKENGK